MAWFSSQLPAGGQATGGAAESGSRPPDPTSEPGSQLGSIPTISHIFGQEERPELEHKGHDPFDPAWAARADEGSMPSKAQCSDAIAAAEEVAVQEQSGAQETQGFWSRMFGKKNPKVAAEPQPSAEEQMGKVEVQEGKQECQRGHGALEHELSALEKAPLTPADDFGSMTQNDVLGVIEIIHADVVSDNEKESDDDQALSPISRQMSLALQTQKELSKETSFEDFHKQAQAKRNSSNLAAFQRMRWWQKKLLPCLNLCCNGLQQRLFAVQPGNDDFPDFPAKNMLGQSCQSKNRRFFMRLAASNLVEFIWMLNNTLHLMALILRKSNILPFWMSYICTGMYILEFLIKVIGWGFIGGKKSYWNLDLLNRIQVVVLLSSIAETALALAPSLSAATFTLRGFGMFRLFRFLMQVETFASLNMFLFTAQKGSLPLGTVVSVLILFMVFLGVIGMATFRSSFRRRCVWADTLELKSPEQWCKRFHRSEDPIAIDNNCGPLQMCVDATNPNNGFSSFDNMPATLLTLFQTLSNDGQYQIMWACLQSEPNAGWFTVTYFLCVGILIGEVLINVFVAVLANLLKHFRAVLNQQIEERQQRQSEEPQATQQDEVHLASKPSGSPTSNLSASPTFNQSPNNSFLIKEWSSSVNLTRDQQSDVLEDLSGEKGASGEVVDDLMEKENEIEAKGEVQLLHENTQTLTVVAAIVFRSPLYRGFVMLVIFGNSCTLAMIGSFGSSRMDDLLADVNTYCAIFFLVDWILQVLCDGSFAKYFSDGKHIYDFVVIIPTTFAMVAEGFGAKRQQTAVLRALGILRLMRGCEFFWLRPIWLMLLEAVRSASLVINLVIILVFFLIAYYAVGEQLFAPGALDPRANFESFLSGTVMLFQIMTGDSWSGLMYVGLGAACVEVPGTEEDLYPHHPGNKVGTFLPENMVECEPGTLLANAAFYIVFFFIGQYVFITLFLALILENFQVTNFMKIGDDTEADSQLVREDAYREVGKLQYLPVEAIDYVVVEKAFYDHADFPSSVHAVISRKKLLHFVSSKRPRLMWKFCKMTGLVYLRYLARAYLFPQRCHSFSFIAPYPGDKDWRFADWKKGAGKEWRAPPVPGEGDPFEGTQFDENRILKKSKIPFFLRHGAFLELTRKRWFGGIVYFAIISSSVMLACETPAEQVDEEDHPYLEEGLMPRLFLRQISPYMFTTIFAIEAVVKIRGLGFFLPNDMTTGAYMQDGWNRVDFVVLLMSALDLALAAFGLDLGSNFTSVVKISRAFRPILLLRKNREMKKVVVAFIGSAKPIFYAVLFLLLVTIMFSTIGMALFKDLFWSCNDDSFDGIAGQGMLECAGNHLVDDIYIPRSWSTPAANFDTFAKACMTLLKCLTLKWVAVLHFASDAYEIDVQPVFKANLPAASLYFAALIVSGSFISLNFFVSFVVDGFYAAQGQGEEEQTEEVYYEWIQQKIVMHWPGEDVPDPDTFLARSCRWLVDAKWFQSFSALCILTNVTLICLSHEGESGEFRAMQDVQNDVFFGIMCAEVMMKFTGQGVHNFWKENFNRFDVLLVIFTSISAGTGSTLRTISQVVRSFRLARFMRTLTRNKLIEAMFDTVMLSIKQVVPVVLVLALGMSIFSVIGVAFFGNVKFGSRLGPQANFQNFTSALLTLLQILFGDEWHDLAEDCSRMPPFCTQNFETGDGRVLSYGDCGNEFGFLYFLTYKVLCEFTILNLFVGMILNNFAFCADGGDKKTIISEEDIKRFAYIWVKEADPNCTGTIPLDFIYKLMFRIGSPLGMYGDKQNIGRFLCVREHVRLQVQRLDDSAQMPYALRVFRWLCEIERLRHERTTLEWKEMQKTARQYMRELKIRDFSKKKTSNERSEWSDSDDTPSGSETEQSDDENMSAESDNTVEGTRSERRANVVANHFGYASKSRQWISGGNMGSGGGKGSGVRRNGKKRAGKVKKVKVQAEVYNMSASQLAQLQEQKVRDKKDQQILEDRMKVAHINEANATGKPPITWDMKLAGSIRWFVEGMISKRTAVLAKRMPTYACFDDVFNALLYWNNKDDVIPSFLIEDRRLDDDLIVTAVANQIIEGLLRGAIFRRHRRQINNNLIRQQAVARSVSIMKKFHKDKDKEKEDLLIAAKRLPTPILRPHTALANACEMVLHEEGADTDSDRGILATLITEGRVDSHKLAEKATSWGFKMGDDEIIGLDQRGIRLILQQPEVEQARKELTARRNIHSLSGNEARLLRMAADMNGIDLMDVDDIADLPYEDLLSILNESTVRNKLISIQDDAAAAEEARRESERALMAPKTPQEVAELRRVQKQKQRLEQLNKQIMDDRQELLRQLEASTKQTASLTKEYEHARREAAHFQSEAMLAKKKFDETLRAQEEKLDALPEQLDMTVTNALGGTLQLPPGFELEPEEEVNLTPEEQARELEGKIAIQKDALMRLEKKLGAFKSGDPALAQKTGIRLPSSWAYRGDPQAMKALKAQKIQEAKQKREQRIHGDSGPSSGVLAALGIATDAPKLKHQAAAQQAQRETRAAKKSGEAIDASRNGAKKQPAWL